MRDILSPQNVFLVVILSCFVVVMFIEPMFIGFLLLIGTLCFLWVYFVTAVLQNSWKPWKE